MPDFKIIGNPSPEVGKEIIYKTSNSDHVSLLPGQITPFEINPFAEQIKWSVYILEFGKWVLKEKNNKTGPAANYTFTEKSLKRKGIRIVARFGEEKAILDIKPQDNIERKIVKVELCDALGNLQTKPFAYNQTVLAKVHCLNLNDCTVHVTLWEDDAPGAGHSEINKNNKAVTKSERVSNGIANVKFKLAVDFAKIANAHLAGGDKSEGKTHEYYVTAEIFRQKTESSNNINVINPDKNGTAPQKPVSQKQAPKPTDPAAKKGPSKKEEKGITETVSGTIYDWGETMFKTIPLILPDPIEVVNSLAKIFMPEKKEKDKKESNKPKLVIFPLLVKPENDKENKWGEERNWTAKQGANMTTFNSNRDHGKRKHAARDLYTNALETVVAIADGIVLDIKPFYCETNQVTVRHTLKDGRDFIIRYGELDPKSISVKIGQKVTQKQELGKTGKLLKYLKKEKKSVPLMEINDTIVYMLHFEHFIGSLKFDLDEAPLSDTSKPYNRRGDLIDSLSILQEGYNNSFGSKPTINKDEIREFTEHDARLALMKIYDLYGKEMAQTIESIYRWEGKHFKSDQYKICGSPGMEVSGNNPPPNYGWDGSLYKKNPEYTPIGIWESFENKGKSGAGGNDQDTKNKKKYIKFPSVEAGMMYIVDFINRHDGNVGRWHSTDKKIQENYTQEIKTAIPRIVNQF